MNKIKKIDFVIRDNGDEQIIFRFRPRQSSCHSFGDDPPTSWDDVYKVYYSYSIFKKYKDDNTSKILFDCKCDECSSIDKVATRCLYLADGCTSIDIKHPYTGEPYTIHFLDNEIHPFGYGVHWSIKQLNDNLYSISMFNCDDVGYRFCLKQYKLKEFGNYLNKCCEYMLAHGDPI